MASTNVEVNTGETEIADASVSIKRPDESSVVIDTAEDDFDTIIEPAPVQKPPAAPPVAPSPIPIFRPPTPVQPKEPRHHRRRHKKTSGQADETGSVSGYMDEHPEFAAAMRRTVKPPAAVLDDDSNDEEPEPERRRGRKRERTPSPSDSEISSHSSSSRDRNVDDAAESVDSFEAKDLPPAEAIGEEDEYIEKMKLMEEIKGYAKIGAVPPKPPTFDMPASLLRKIRDYQASVVDEIVGVGFIGMGWVQLIGLIEKLNGRYDPFAKAFGVGLKLSGSKQAVEENIHLYEASFKHIYRKLGLDKQKDLGPWAQLVIVTVQILTKVHVSNMEREMAEQAREMARDPMTRQRAERMQQMYENRRQQQETVAVAASPAPPPQPVPPVLESKTDPTPQPTIKPVEDIVIDMQQPETDADEDAPVSGAETPDGAGSSDDDDVVVQIPTTRRKGAKKTDN